MSATPPVVVAVADAAPAGSSGTAGIAPDAPGGWRRAIVRSEWRKITSLRSTYITLVVTEILFIGLGTLFCFLFVNRYRHLSPTDPEVLTFDPAFSSVSGVLLAQFAIGVLGALTMTAEHTTGMIRTSLAAVPNRLRLLGAKVVVFLGVSLVVGFLGSFVAFGLGQWILAGQGLGTSIGDAASLRVVVGAALSLALFGLFALGLGTMVRRTAGAIAAFFGLVLVLPLVVAALPSPWNTDIGRYLPDAAGRAMIRTVRQGDLLPPWGGFALLCAYAAVTLVLGAALLQRRDA